MSSKQLLIIFCFFCSTSTTNNLWDQSDMNSGSALSPSSSQTLLKVHYTPIRGWKRHSPCSQGAHSPLENENVSILKTSNDMELPCLWYLSKNGLCPERGHKDNFLPNGVLEPIQNILFFFFTLISNSNGMLWVL